MSKIRFSVLFSVCLFLVTSISNSVSGQSEGDQSTNVANAPGIEGTYKFVKRVLPDGKEQVPPDINGLLTYTGSYRNFNIYWKDPEGKVFSISYIAAYELTPEEYSENCIYYMVNDQIGGKGISYDFSNPSGKSPVKVEGGRIEFKLPLHNEPVVVFDGDGFTATREGEFVDHWEKVD